MRKQAGQVLADAEEGGLPQLLGAVAAAEKTDAEVRQRAAASMFQMPSPTITAVMRWHSPLLFAGPAVIASIAYMDPGNFATNIQAGAKYGYSLLWVVLMANVIAMLYQALSAKLGIVTGRNLAEMCRERSRWSGRCGSSAKWRRWRPTLPNSSAAPSSFPVAAYTPGRRNGRHGRRPPDVRRTGVSPD